MPFLYSLSRQRPTLQAVPHRLHHEHHGQRAMDEPLFIALHVAGVVRVEMDGVGIVGERAEVEKQRWVRLDDEGDCGLFVG
jgi:hypothetical protein